MLYNTWSPGTGCSLCAELLLELVLSLLNWEDSILALNWIPSWLATLSPDVESPCESLVNEFSFLRVLSTWFIEPSFGGGVFCVTKGLA